jgi:hypothetical protein
MAGGVLEHDCRCGGLGNLHFGHGVAGVTEECEQRTVKENSMGALEGKVAVITGGNRGIGLATAQRFVKEGAYVFITGRRQEELDKAVSLIGRNVTAVQGGVSKLDDLDRLYVKDAGPEFFSQRRKRLGVHASLR